MNPTPDDFEARLAALRPAPVSPDLLGRIESVRQARRRKRLIHRLAYTGIAAAIAGAMLAHSLFRHPDGVDRGRANLVLTATVAPEPTAWRYRQAAAQSPEQLDELLQQDEHRFPLNSPRNDTVSLQSLEREVERDIERSPS